jgi:hypothetical protein
MTVRQLTMQRNSNWQFKPTFRISPNIVKEGIASSLELQILDKSHYKIK